MNTLVAYATTTHAAAWALAFKVLDQDPGLAPTIPSWAREGGAVGALIVFFLWLIRRDDAVRKEERERRAAELSQQAESIKFERERQEKRDAIEAERVRLLATPLTEHIKSWQDNYRDFTAFRQEVRESHREQITVMESMEAALQKMASAVQQSTETLIRLQERNNSGKPAP